MVQNVNSSQKSIAISAKYHLLGALSTRKGESPQHIYPAHGVFMALKTCLADDLAAGHPGLTEGADPEQTRHSKASFTVNYCS